MAVEGGGGAHTEGGMELLPYARLRHMVLADDPEGLRVASAQWASMYRELADRVTTVEVAIRRLSAVWHGAGGRAALAKYNEALGVMQSAMWTAKGNADNLGDAYDAMVKAQKQMRALDATTSKPAVAPSADRQPYAWEADSRQPTAYEIAKNLSYAYAWAGAGYSPLSYESRWRGGNKTTDGIGSARSGGAPSAGGRSRSVGDSDGSPNGAGGGVPGGVIASRGSGGGRGSGPALRGSQPPADGVRPPTAGPQPSAIPDGAPGSSPGFGVPGGAPGGAGTSGSRRGGFGATGGRGGFGGGRGTVRFGGGNPGGKTLGGGMRPTSDTPVEPTVPPSEPGVAGYEETGQVPPGSGVPGTPGGAGHGGRRSKRKPGYERGEPEIFLDGRSANPAGGTIRQPGAVQSFDAMPGMLGSQKHKPVEEHDHSQWELPATTPTPEGFPDKVEDGKFTRRDGVQFEVRRRKGGA